MIIKYNFAEIHTEVFNILQKFAEKDESVTGIYRSLFVAKEIASNMFITYDKKTKIQLTTDIFDSHEAAENEVQKECMQMVLSKIIGIHTDTEVIRFAYELAVKLGVKIAEYDFSKAEENVTICFDNINKMYYVA